MFLPYNIFQCRHNIRNQPVSTAIPSPGSFCDITTTRAHQRLGEILKYVLFHAFLRQYYIKLKHSTGICSIGFHSYSLELAYKCSCNNFFSLLLTKEFWVLVRSDSAFALYTSSSASASHNICPPQPTTTQPFSSPTHWLGANMPRISYG